MSRMRPPSRLKAYLDLCRVSNLPTVWTNVLAALLLSGSEFSCANFCLLALSLSLYYSGGMCLNDIRDVSRDRLQRPNRPIPSGRVSQRGAWWFTVLLFTSGMSLLAAAPHPRALLAGGALLLLIIAYDILHQAHSYSILLMAACRLTVFVVAAMAVSGTVGGIVLLAGGLQFGYVFLISAVARHEHGRNEPYPAPLVPLMLAGISLVDGVALVLLASPAWLLAGLVGAILTLLGQRCVRGD